jgi:putative transposase
MAQSYTNLLDHILFSTAERRPSITVEIEPRLHEYMGGIVKSNGGIPLAINGMPDHVHLLAKLRQDVALSDFLRELKSVSSGWVHDTFPQAGKFGWQNGYTAFTVSKSQAVKVATYIRNQKQHHRKTGSVDELKMLLRAHGVDFDEKYL